MELDRINKSLTEKDAQIDETSKRLAESLKMIDSLR